MNLYLSAGGFGLKITFSSTDRAYLQSLFVENIKATWGSFLVGKIPKVDFEIEIASEEGKDAILVRESGKKYYFLTFIRNFQKRKVKTYYSISPANFDLLLKEILLFLTHKDGFLLHGSGLTDKNGFLSLFMAPSGGGKSTTALNLADNNRVLFSDDIVIARRLGGKWHFFSTPFIGKGGPPKPGQTTRARFYLVKKSKEGGVEKVTAKSKILPFILGQIWLKERLPRRTLANALKFLKENEFYILNATLNKKVMRKVIYET